MIIATKRLILREMTQADFSAIAQILKDDETMYAYEGAFSDEEVTRWIDKQISRYYEYGFGLWAVVSKENNKIIGQCGLTMQEFNGKQVLEVGYLFNKHYWHNGYATEASISCKEYAFNNLNANEVYSIIRHTNIASQNVAKRNGMELVGEIIKHYKNIDMPHLVYKANKT